MFHLGTRRAPFGPPDGQRDRTARAQQRPLDHRGVWHQPVREPHARGGRLAARLDRPPQRCRDGQPDRQEPSIGRSWQPNPAPACISTASTRLATAARWDTSPASGRSSCEGPPGSRGGVQLTSSLACSGAHGRIGTILTNQAALPSAGLQPIAAANVAWWGRAHRTGGQQSVRFCKMGIRPWKRG
jgi:hypothetical protein